MVPDPSRRRFSPLGGGTYSLICSSSYSLLLFDAVGLLDGVEHHRQHRFVFRNRPGLQSFVNSLWEVVSGSDCPFRGNPPLPSGWGSEGDSGAPVSFPNNARGRTRCWAIIAWSCCFRFLTLTMITWSVSGICAPLESGGSAVCCCVVCPGSSFRSDLRQERARDKLFGSARRSSTQARPGDLA